MTVDEQLIITGASQPFADSLQALLGSLNLNWPDHPRVLVYDLGLEPPILVRLESAGIEVRRVPPFCPHWRQHFTWKVWAIHDAPCRDYLWLDAGLCVLRPLDDAFIAIRQLGYFAPSNGWTLRDGICEPLRQALALSRDDLGEMLSITGGVHGLSKEGKGAVLVREALQLALDEQNMQATEPLHRHDQALLSALLYRHFAPLLFADHLLYAGWHSAEQFAGQKIWVHRRSLRPEDMAHFSRHLREGGPPYLPGPPLSKRVSLQTRLRAALGRLRRQSGSRAAVYDGVRK